MEVCAVVLAGGPGTRLRPLTDRCPKPLLPLGPEPLVAYQLRRLAAIGVRQVVLAIGYLATEFERQLGDGTRWGLQLQRAVETEPLGTGGALRAAVDRLPVADRVIVLNGDLLSSHDLGAQSAALGTAQACLHVRPVPDVAPYGQVTCDVEGRVHRFAEKTGRGPGLANAGTYVVRADLLRALPGGPSSWERDVLPSLLRNDTHLVAWRGDGYFRDVGSPEAYRSACVDAATGVLPKALGTAGDAYVAVGAQVAPDAILRGGSSIQPGAVIDVGAHLDATVVLDGAHVGAGARLLRCVVASGARVPAGAVRSGEVLRTELTGE